MAATQNDIIKRKQQQAAASAAPAPAADDPMVTGSFSVPHSIDWQIRNDPNGLLAQQAVNAQQTAAQNQAYINNFVQPAVLNGQGANQDLFQQQMNNSGNLWGQTAGYVNTNNALIGEASQNRDWANGQDANTLAALQAGLGQTSAFDMGTYNTLAGKYAGYGQLSSTPYQGAAMSNAGDLARQQGAYDNLSGIGQGSLNYQSQGAQAYANPQDIANQNQANSFFQLGMNGGLDYASQASNAYATPDDYARQSAAELMLQRASGGYFNTDATAGRVYADPTLSQNQDRASSLLYNFGQGWQGQTASAAQEAYADQGADQLYRDSIGQLGGVAGGSLDAHADPAALAEQRGALDKYKSLTDPTVTAQERYIYEQARERQEQDERASRGAVMNDLRSRGMSGSGMEIGNQLGLQQQQSQNRLLSDLGAQSNAVNRSMQALQGYGNLSSTMVDQSFGQDNANKQRALQGLSLYTDAAGKLRSATFDEAYKRGLAGDANAMANADRMLQAAGMSYQAAADLRNTAFKEAAFRAQATDANAVTNANRQLQAAGMDADMTTNMRNQGFSESYARGQAADQASQFNSQIKLASGAQFADLSTDMRNAGFSEAYNRGIAADNTSANNQRTMASGAIAAGDTASRMREASDKMSSFNNEQLGISNRAGDLFRADQQQQAQTRDATLANVGLQANQGVRTDQMNLATAGYNTTGRQDARNNDVLNAKSQVNNQNLGAWNSWTGQNNATLAQGQAINQQGVNNALGLGSLTTGTALAGLGAQQAPINAAIGFQSGQAAANAAEDAAASSGLFGTGIGSRKDPLWLPNLWQNPGTKYGA